MKARIIHTKFYESERVLQLSASSRWLFMYYLTCTGIGLTGAFKWSDSKTIFETGLSGKDLEKAKLELLQARLVYFSENWVVIPDTNEKNNYTTGSKTAVGYESEMKTLPENVKKLLVERPEENTPIIGVSDVSATVDTPRIQNTEIRNQKKDESVREGDELNDQFCEETALELKIPPSLVRRTCLSYQDYVKSTGKRYKSKRATVRGWLRRDIQNKKIIPYQATTSKPTQDFVPVSAERVAQLREKARSIL